MYRYLVSNEKDTARREGEAGQREVVGDYENVVEAIRKSIVGEDAMVAGCGLPVKTRGRKMLYTDYTASGRGVGIVEDFMRTDVMPMYGNTHTVSSGTARQTTYYRQEARSIVKNYYNCTFEDALIFSGNGATGATATFVNLLRRTRALTNPSKVRAEDRWGSIRCTVCSTTFKNDKLFRAHASTQPHLDAVTRRTNEQHTTTPYKGCLLIIDPMAHHSSILPYRELVNDNPTFFQLEAVALDETKGHLCTQDLSRILARCDKEKLKPVAVLTAASNVTGIYIDMAVVNTLVHAHDGVVCWDLAAVAGHMKVDLNPAPLDGKGDPSCDFAVVSPHKLLGGPGCVGIFFAKKKYLTNEVPCTVGGGIVHYVSPRTHSYIDNHEEREEAGTPNIIGCIKTGVVFRMHSMVDGALIHKRETLMLQSLMRQLGAHPKVEILGRDCTAERVGILSFNVQYGAGLYLHYNFVTVLLNDLFGIQVRGGCACAGPYSQWLLEMEQRVVDGYSDILVATGQNVLRPGFVRTGVHFTMTGEEVETIGKAILWVADHGWKLLGAYKFDDVSGSWEYAHQQHGRELRTIAGKELRLGGLSRASYAHMEMTARQKLAEADELLLTVYAEGHVPLREVVDDGLEEDVEEWVFFARPKDLVHSVRKVLSDVDTVKDWKKITPAAEGSRKVSWK